MEGATFMKAIVLGALEGTGNIGDETALHLRHTLEMEVVTHDCSVGLHKNPFGYEVPYLYEDFRDAEALVVTLGRTTMDPFDKISPEELEAVIYGSLTLPLLAAREYVACREGKGGKIVFVGSYAHRHPFSTGTAYCAAKAGLDMAGRTLGWELTDKGYQTFVLHPYHIAGTPMWEKVQDGVMRNKDMTREEADAYAEKDLKMELMRPTDIAEMIGLVLTENVLQWMSGSNFELFGGTR
jgi:NAD(P)-dependent dehydrogenase (short-subunit alcohol dehydrogenase family)